MSIIKENVDIGKKVSHHMPPTMQQHDLLFTSSFSALCYLISILIDAFKDKQTSQFSLADGSE